MKLSVGVSNRHVHLTKDVWKALFGNEEIVVRNELSQPGQFASTSTVDIKVFDKVINHVRVVGPLRDYNQIEIMESDAKYFGINPPRRQSGDLDGSLGVCLIGPCGIVNLESGLIMADAHVHMSFEDSMKYSFNNKDVLNIVKNGTILFEAKVKVSDGAFLELHIDKDEEALYNLHTGDLVDFELCGK